MPTSADSCFSLAEPHQGLYSRQCMVRALDSGLRRPHYPTGILLSCSGYTHPYSQIKKRRVMYILWKGHKPVVPESPLKFTKFVLFGISF